MRTFLEAATGLPALLFTAALVVIACFWLLVAVGATTPDSFDADADLKAWGLGGVPVMVALTLVTVFAWFLAVGAAVLLAACALPGTVTGVLRLLAPPGALLLAWLPTRLLVRSLHRLFPDEPSRPAAGTGGDGTCSPNVPAGTGGPVRYFSYSTAQRPLRARDRVA
ncbi:hypothetical protein AB0L85_17100 [Streptomyces sp. NPDC052051]|uniref:hypothetical protein n=1 Tax=Streptomyces sp. NPDC052051 TaxID=3154649 RepID=UPI00343097C8